MKNQKIYFIAILPDEEFQTQVTGIKRYIAENFQSKHALRSPPHITLHMPFKWQEEKEKIVFQTLLDFCKGKEEFEVSMNGFDVFEPRVIFIDLEPNQSLQDLQSELVRQMKTGMNLFNANYKDRGFHPHMTIAHRDLKKPKFYEAWDHFKDKELAHTFSVKSIWLLKHNGKTWDTYREFEFY